MGVPEQLDDVAACHKEAIVAFLVRAFPRLAAEAEDIFHEVFVEALDKAQREGFVPSAGWPAWFRWCCRNRAVDRRRSEERQIFQNLSEPTSTTGAAGMPPADDAPGPATQAAEKERRGRQGLLLSHILADFCRWCESRPEGSRLKAIYERRLRGESPAHIATALGIPRNTVDQAVKRARDWIFQRICQADVEGTVFVTLRVGPRPASGTPAAADKPAPPPHARTVDLPAGPPPPRHSPAPQNLAEVVRWVVEELGAVCPGPERLHAYRATPNNPELEDVRYHLETACCRICQAHAEPATT